MIGLQVDSSSFSLFSNSFFSVNRFPSNQLMIASTASSNDYQRHTSFWSRQVALEGAYGIHGRLWLLEYWSESSLREILHTFTICMPHTRVVFTSSLHAFFMHAQVIFNLTILTKQMLILHGWLLGDGSNMISYLLVFLSHCGTSRIMDQFFQLHLALVENISSASYFQPKNK